MAGSSSRMLTLLSLLQSRRDWPAAALSERLDVSPRTVRRDVDRLRSLGYRVSALRGRGGGYRLAAGTELPPLLFDEDQAVAVALALAVAPASGADIAESAARALATVRQVMPERLRHRVDAVQVLASATGALVDPDVLVAVSDATRNREILRFDYAGPDAAHDSPPRRVEPHAVVARNGRWYLLAWNPSASPAREQRAGDWRTYRVDRITPRAPTRARFSPRPIPGGDPVSFVEARFKGSAGEDAWPCIGTAIVDLAAEQLAPYLDADATLAPTSPGSSRVTMGSWSWGALAARFAGFDVELAVVEPPELRAAAIEIGRRLRAAGGHPDRVGPPGS